jgi:cytochrome c biogenesis protein CcmG/thiol:disulfide interchange protein DsbE
MKKVTALAVPLALLLFFGAVLARCGNSQGNYPQAPDFQVMDLSGKSISLSDYKGKVLFLNFWATWCPPCRAEIPDFVEVYGQQKAKGLEILGISLDSKGKDAIVAFVEKFKINYPVVLETRNTTEKIIDDYQPGQFIPTTIVIDKQGRIRNKQVGQMTKDMLLKYFQQLAAE